MAPSTETSAPVETNSSSSGFGFIISGSNSRQRNDSRDSLKRSLSKRRPSVELQRLNILKSDPTDLTTSPTMQQAANHIELQQTRETKQKCLLSLH